MLTTLFASVFNRQTPTEVLADYLRELFGEMTDGILQTQFLLNGVIINFQTQLFYGKSRCIKATLNCPTHYISFAEGFYLETISSPKFIRWLQHGIDYLHTQSRQPWWNPTLDNPPPTA